MKDKELTVFFSNLPENEQKLALKLFEVIASYKADFEIKLSYKSLFFFYKKKRLFYLWPASIPWGGISEGVRLAFVHGYLFHDDIRRHLSFNDRKEIGVMDFTQLEQIDAAMIITLLTEATHLV